MKPWFIYYSLCTLALMSIGILTPGCHTHQLALEDKAAESRLDQDAKRPFIFTVRTTTPNTTVSFSPRQYRDIASEVLCTYNSYFCTDRNYIYALTRTFSEPGDYAIQSQGDIQELKLCETENGEKKDYTVLSVDQWGDVEWQSMEKMFADCEELELKATDTPNLTHVKSMSFMFSHAKKMNQPIGSWNVSHVTDMSSMFEGAASFNQPIGSWNVSHVECMREMFMGSKSFNQPVEKWNVSHTRIYYRMFQGASAVKQPLDRWAKEYGTNLKSLF